MNVRASTADDRAAMPAPTLRASPARPDARPAAHPSAPARRPGVKESARARVAPSRARILRGPMAAVLPDPAVAPSSRAGSRLRVWASTGLALAGSTLVCALIERYFEPANLITVYLAAVVYVALRNGRGAAAFAVLGSIALFDLLFVAPRWSFKPTDPQYFFTFAVMLVVGLLVAQLAARARQEAAKVEARARRAQALNQLALELARARTGEAVGAALEATIGQALGARAHLLLTGEDGRLAPLPSDWVDEAPVAERALREQRDTGAGSEVEPTLRRRYVPLLGAEGPLGVLVVERVQAEPDHALDRDLLQAIAHQASVVLERAVFEQRGARTAVEAERERLRSTLLAGISHDFRTPLTTIIGSATSLLDQGHALGDADRQALLRGVVLEAQRLHALTSDLLDLTRMEEGAVRLSPEWCPADELVAEARAAMGQRLDGHRVEVELDDEAVVWCDACLTGQALVNLLDNAVRHTPPGGAIRVRVEVAPHSWRLVVHDEGPGVAVGQERDVFKKFFRARQEPQARGTGLGLAICAVVAELHGGTIAVANQGGARFELTFPQPDDSSTRLREAE